MWLEFRIQVIITADKRYSVDLGKEKKRSAHLKDMQESF